MLLYRNSQTDPSFNLALEEWLLTASQQDSFFLWQNRPSIIIGRNQNANAEINQDYVQQNGIPVVRRLSGGGAVYHDLGNLNFTFISHDAHKKFDFRLFARPIIEVLEKLGVKAEYSGRNDIVIDGKKFSGNAQYVQGNKVLHHGTLLFDSDLSILQQALKVAPGKYESKGVKSVASRVTNIVPYLKQPLSIKEFAELLFMHIKDSIPGAAFAEFSEQDYTAARRLVQAKYGNWEWNFGKSAAYNFSNSLRFPGGAVEARLLVEQGVIERVKIYGDFFGLKPIEEVEARLSGIRHSYTDICRALEGVELGEYFAGIDREDIIKVFL